MTESTPWWYSGAAQPQGADASSDEAASDRSRFDLAGLASGAQQLVDFARQALLAPHAGHTDSRAHPECVICRTMGVLGEARAGSERTPVAIEWIALEPPRR